MHLKVFANLTQDLEVPVLIIYLPNHSNVNSTYNGIDFRREILGGKNNRVLSLSFCITTDQVFKDTRVILFERYKLQSVGPRIL